MNSSSRISTATFHGGPVSCSSTREYLPFGRRFSAAQADPLAIVQVFFHRMEENVFSVLVHNFQDAPFADPNRSHAGPEIAGQEIGHAAVRRENIKYRPDRLASGKELDPGQDHPLLKDLGRIGGHAAGHHAAHIVPVGNIGRPGHDLAVSQRPA